MAPGQLTDCIAWTLARFHGHNLEANSAHRLAAREPFRYRTPTADRSYHLAVLGARVALTIEACRVLRPQLVQLRFRNQAADRLYHLAVLCARVVPTIEACRVFRPQLVRLSLSQPDSGPFVSACSFYVPASVMTRMLAAYFASSLGDFRFRNQTAGSVPIV
jgi:hypothetical protein